MPTTTATSAARSAKARAAAIGLLLFYDVTFSQVDGNAVEPYDFDPIVAKAFAKTLREDKDPARHD
ncbi:MAG: hypothetical protein ACKO4T_09885 [Planctomycetaceae bacterium]